MKNLRGLSDKEQKNVSGGFYFEDGRVVLTDLNELAILFEGLPSGVYNGEYAIAQADIVNTGRHRLNDELSALFLGWIDAEQEELLKKILKKRK